MSGLLVELTSNLGSCLFIGRLAASVRSFYIWRSCFTLSGLKYVILWCSLCSNLCPCAEVYNGYTHGFRSDVRRTPLKEKGREDRGRFRIYAIKNAQQYSLMIACWGGGLLSCLWGVVVSMASWLRCYGRYYRVGSHKIYNNERRRGKLFFILYLIGKFNYMSRGVYYLLHSMLWRCVSRVFRTWFGGLRCFGLESKRETGYVVLQLHLCIHRAQS